jgi:hypothetical protein
MQGNGILHVSHTVVGTSSPEVIIDFSSKSIPQYIHEWNIKRWLPSKKYIHIFSKLISKSDWYNFLSKINNYNIYNTRDSVIYNVNVLQELNKFFNISLQIPTNKQQTQTQQIQKKVKRKIINKQLKNSPRFVCYAKNNKTNAQEFFVTFVAACRYFGYCDTWLSDRFNTHGDKIVKVKRNPDWEIYKF